MNRDFATLDQVVEIVSSRLGVPISKQTIKNYIKKRNFPNHLRIGWPRVWDKKEIDDWLDIHTMNI